MHHLAAGIILAHNQPGGSSAPSDLDVEVTKPLIQSGNLLGIAGLDHIVIGNGEYSSLKEKSLLPTLRKSPWGKEQHLNLELRAVEYENVMFKLYGITHFLNM